jgi:hypothetical protein
MSKLPAHAIVPWTDCEPLINLIRNKTGSSFAEVALACGWSESFFQKAVRDGVTRKSVKYGLLGLAVEMQASDKLPTTTSLTKDEWAEVFQALMTERKRSPGNSTLPTLLAKVAKELAP